MLHEDLLRMADPVLDRVLRHPFWTGLAEGDVAPEALAAFVAQDVHHLLPTYARARARAAAAAGSDAHTALLGRSAFSTLEARDRLRGAYAELAPRLGLPGLESFRPIAPATRAHCATFTAATATSFGAGVGALLPMVWFNHRVADSLLERCVPGSRYAEWISVYHPGEGYRYAVKAFLAMVDAVGERAVADERAQLVEHFAEAVAHEPVFADSALQHTAVQPEPRGAALSGGGLSAGPPPSTRHSRPRRKDTA